MVRGLAENIAVINVGIVIRIVIERLTILDVNIVVKNLKIIQLKENIAVMIYIRDRFWRKEDAAEIMKKLIKGEKVENIPKWIKENLKNI